MAAAAGRVARGDRRGAGERRWLDARALPQRPLYRSALEIRRRHPTRGDGSMESLDGPAGVLSFTREPGFGCLVNVAGEPVPLPGGAVLLASRELTDDGHVPRDTAVWLDR